MLAAAVTWIVCGCMWEQMKFGVIWVIMSNACCIIASRASLSSSNAADHLSLRRPIPIRLTKRWNTYEFC